LPALERVLAGQMFFLPLFLRSFSTLRPVGLAMRVRKPEVRRRALQGNEQQLSDKTCAACMLEWVIDDD
jgi:hypothetical protein